MRTPESASPRSPAARRQPKSWREKLANDKGLPRIIELNAAAAARWGGRTLVIPAPREVDALMRMVPAGCVVTTNDLRTALAARHRTEATCPVTTGVFAWIAAHAAEEAAAAGLASITPYWRTLKVRGELNPRYPGGIPAQAARLEAEGHQIRQKGKRFFVADYEQHVARLDSTPAASEIPRSVDGGPGPVAAPAPEPVTRRGARTTRPRRSARAAAGD